MILVVSDVAPQELEKAIKPAPTRGVYNAVLFTHLLLGPVPARGPRVGIRLLSVLPISVYVLSGTVQMYQQPNCSSTFLRRVAAIQLLSINDRAPQCTFASLRRLAWFTKSIVQLPAGSSLKLFLDTATQS